MITNQRQQRITTGQIKRFEDAISRAQQDGPTAGVDARLNAAMIEGMRSQLDELRDELDSYEALREGRVRKRTFHSFLEIPLALIEGRIARRLTQKQLGEKLRVPEQQIQRYERTRYSGVGVERLQEIADILQIKIKKTVEYDVTDARLERTVARSTGASKAGRTTGRTRSTSVSPKGANTMTTRKTGKAAASAAGKTLSSKTASNTAKKAAASDLAQVGNQKVTGRKAASAAGKTLASKSASKTAKKAAASDLSQAAKKKR
jgi:transcriptional regulator with XRE-family HTH domain